MALNKFMHPRNIYRTPPDFSKLAKDYMDFSNVAKKDISGKVSIDFRDPKSLRVLTKCLLKSDFNLDVTIPEDRLVPTLPLRLNYILWIEDLLTAVHLDGLVKGIDIGTGACAIYPLLAAVKNKWHMFGTETDIESLRIAQENVKKNNLQNIIQLKQNPTTCIFEHVIPDDNDQIFHFCMCNPPFYTSLQELWESRSPARPEPKNGFTGSPHELITEGGELQFCRKMIEESKNYRDKILIFTTMIGHKYNLKELVIDLKAEGIRHTTTEFCQGRVTRWGVAWTYQDYDFSILVESNEKSKKKSSSITFILPDLPVEKNDVASYLEKIKNILSELKITHKIINKKKNEVSMNIIAHSNTWSNQRRKRRLLKRMNESQDKKAKTEMVNNGSNKMNASDLEEDQYHEDVQKNIPNSDLVVKEEKEIIVQGFLKMFMIENHPNIELEYLNGSAGREGLHQILQYIKNNWK